VRSESDEGDQTRGNGRLWAALFLSVAVGSPELRLARARVAPGSPEFNRERERHGELNGGEEAMNPWTENGERQ
jgi:hypothetical protein